LVNATGILILQISYKIEQESFKAAI